MQDNALMEEKIKKIIHDTTEEPKHLDKLEELYSMYAFNKDSLSPSEFCDLWQVKETGVTYNQARYYLFEDNLHEIIEDELKPRPQTDKEWELLEQLVEEYFNKGVKHA
jgi:hypothetical protein